VSENEPIWVSEFLAVVSKPVRVRKRKRHPWYRRRILFPIRRAIQFIGLAWQSPRDFGPGDHFKSVGLRTMFVTFLIVAILAISPPPGQNKVRHYHYERRVVRFFNRRGEVRDVPVWKRVDDQ
jgi:hypothetical protein